ncbi:MAG: TonB-dependent receptor [Pseudomonadota bacterium]
MPSSLARGALAGALGAVVACGSAAEPARDLTALPLEELMALEVASASRFPQKASEAPSAVTVITADDIRAHGYRTLAEALRSVRGLHVTYDRNYAYLGALGFGLPGDYNTRVQLLIDGLRVNDNIYDQAPIGTDFPLDMDLVERIEFVPGPGSSVYGANAFFGVINVITRRGETLDGSDLAAGAGSLGRTEGRWSWGRKLENGADILVSVSGLRSRGADLRYDEFVALGVPDGTARGLDYDRARQLFARFTLGPWSARLVHGGRTKGIPTAAYGTVPAAPGSQTFDARSLLDFGYAGALREHLDLSARIFFGNYRYVGDYLYDYPPLTINRDEASGAWWGAEAKLVHAGGRGHKLVLGAQLQRDAQKEQRNFDVEPYAPYLHDRRRGLRLGLYAQDEVELRANLRLNAGVRLERASGRSASLHPRLALVAHPGERLSLKAIYGSAYRPPNAYESYYTVPGPGGQKAGAGLKDERVRTAEFVVEAYPSRRLRVRANAFRFTVRDLIAQDIDPADGLPTFRNTAKVRSVGAGLEIEHRRESGARVRASLGVQRATGADGIRLLNSPRALLKVSGVFPFGAGMTAGAELQYTAARRSLAGEVPAYAIANLNLAIPLGRPKTELSIALRNLFDRRYADPGGTEHLQDRIEQDGRTLLVRLRLGF